MGVSHNLLHLMGLIRRAPPPFTTPQNPLPITILPPSAPNALLSIHQQLAPIIVGDQGYSVSPPIRLNK